MHTLLSCAAATEAHSLLLGRLFEAGYRRVVWGADAQNTSSMRAAQRLGFLLETIQRDVGVQRSDGGTQLVGRSEATLSILEWEWAAISHAHKTWLHPANFQGNKEDGKKHHHAPKQKQQLSQLTAGLRLATSTADAPAPDCWPLRGEPLTATNVLHQPLGADLNAWTPPELPSVTPMAGKHCRLEPVSVAKHAQSLFAALQEGDPHGLSFTYTGISGLTQAPTMEEVEAWLKVGEEAGFVYAILVPDESDGGWRAAGTLGAAQQGTAWQQGRPLEWESNDGDEDHGWRAVGTVQHQAVNPEVGTAAIGFVVHTALLRGTTAGTEAHYLALRRLFEAGYRSVHWGCDSNNEASRRFAQRLG